MTKKETFGKKGCLLVGKYVVRNLLSILWLMEVLWYAWI